jgi:hypothetical protein
MAKIPDKPFNAWLEAVIHDVYDLNPQTIAFASKLEDGSVYTAYYMANATDKTVLAHNIYTDAILDVITANADVIKAAIDELEEEGEEDD